MEPVLRAIEHLQKTVPDPRSSTAWVTAASNVAVRAAEEQALADQLRTAQGRRRGAEERLAALPADTPVSTRASILREMQAALDAEREADAALVAYTPVGDPEEESAAIVRELRTAAKAVAQANQAAGAKLQGCVEKLLAAAYELRAAAIVERGIFHGGDPLGKNLLAAGMARYAAPGTALYPELDPEIVTALAGWLHAVRERAKVAA